MFKEKALLAYARREQRRVEQTEKEKEDKKLRKCKKWERSVSSLRKKLIKFGVIEKKDIYIFIQNSRGQLIIEIEGIEFSLLKDTQTVFMVTNKCSNEVCLDPVTGIIVNNLADIGRGLQLMKDKDPGVCNACRTPFTFTRK